MKNLGGVDGGGGDNSGVTVIVVMVIMGVQIVVLRGSGDGVKR